MSSHLSDFVPSDEDFGIVVCGRASTVLSIICHSFSIHLSAELSFPASFTSEERKFVHLCARHAGLKSKSIGCVSTFFFALNNLSVQCMLLQISFLLFLRKFPQRAVTVMKKKTAKRSDLNTLLELSPQSKALLSDFVKSCPLTETERVELIPREERTDRVYCKLFLLLCILCNPDQ
jgi:hypothetical protein